jgi:hypothetical protein
LSLKALNNPAQGEMSAGERNLTFVIDKDSVSDGDEPRTLIVRHFQRRTVLLSTNIGFTPYAVFFVSFAD